MARRNELTCDRCGERLWGRGGMEWYAKEVSGQIIFWPAGALRSLPGQRIDLCIKCAEEFIQFMSNEEIQRDD